MSNFYDNKSPWFNVNNFHEPEPPSHPDIFNIILKNPVKIIFGFAALTVLCSICKIIRKCCKNEPNGKKLLTINLKFSLLPQKRQNQGYFHSLV